MQVDWISPNVSANTSQTVVVVPYTIIPLDSSGCKSSSSKVALIVGTSVGAVVLVLIIIGVIVTIVLYRQCRQNYLYQLMPLDDPDTKENEEDC